MRILRRGARAILFSASVCAALTVALRQPAFADDHLPIITLTPTIGYGLTGDGINAKGKPTNPPPLDGLITFNGTATLPIAKNLSLSYDKVQNGAYDSSSSSIAVHNHTVYPGANRDILQTYRADYRMGRFNLESGFGSRYRQCCPADFIEWHKGFLGASYTTPHLVFLHDGFFIVSLTANAVHHFSSPNALAALPRGLSLPNNMEIFTTQQAVTAIIPVDKRAGIRTATTFLWGALDFPVNGPFPQYYDVFITAATKQVTKDFGITLTVANVKQRIQGYPFPTPNAIRTSAFTLAANYRIDFNHLSGPPTPSRR